MAVLSSLEQMEGVAAKGRACLAGAKLDLDAPSSTCYICSAAMVVQKTVTRTIASLRFNSISFRERVMGCPNGCKNSDGTKVTERNQTLLSLAPQGSRFAYDVEVFVGFERFVHHRQREEICSSLLDQYGIAISPSEVGVLAKRFLEHLGILHKSRAGLMRKAMEEKDGGYAMHLDATTEGGQGMLLVILSGWNGWALGAWRIPSESCEAIAPCIDEVRSLFGEPVSFMRDLGKGISKAIEQSMAKMVSFLALVFACHFHFLRDIGKDILNWGHEKIRSFAAEHKIITGIRNVIADFKDKVGPECVRGCKEAFDGRIADCGQIQLDGKYGIAFVIVMAQWILDYQSDSKHSGFPFDRPHYNLYQRCLAVAKAAAKYLPQMDCKSAAYKALARLKQTIEPFQNCRAFQRAVREFEKRMELFDKFRALFRLEGEMPESMKAQGGRRFEATRGNEKKAALEYRKFEEGIRKEVDSFKKGLEKTCKSPMASPDIKRAAQIIIKHLEDHGKYLWGHLLELKVGNRTLYRIVERTNNLSEGFFRGMKHDGRRRSGRKSLKKDFEELHPNAAIAMNLSDQDYIKVLCGNAESLPDLFSQIDRGLIRCQHPATEGTGEANGAWKVLKDKKLLRNDAVQEWLHTASGKENAQINIPSHAAGVVQSPGAPNGSSDYFVDGNAFMEGATIGTSPSEYAM